MVNDRSRRHPGPPGQRTHPRVRRGQGRRRRGPQPRRPPPHRRRPHPRHHGPGPRLGRLLLRRADRRAAIHRRQQRRLGAGRQHVPGIRGGRRQRRRHRRRRHPGRRGRGRRQHGLARRPGDEGGDAVLRRQRQLHGRLHDVRRAHHHPRRIRGARRRGHDRRRDLTWAGYSVAGLRRHRDRPAEAEELDSLMRVSRPLRSRLQGHLARRSSTPARSCATRLRRAKVRSIPFFTFSGDSDYWNPKLQEDVFVKSADRPLPVFEATAAPASCRTSPTLPSSQTSPAPVRMPTSSPRSTCTPSSAARTAPSPSTSPCP